ncbi:2,5-diketo-D-gluconic acid reductase [Faecalibacterium sp. An77]|uniref:aldo/keto reductase n=1 Tax=Faecalibacterium sp. An77 TaxID=1965655 RepID=UPI000B386AF1|nr:aldo/keto reductase [Faecalibacterium sp. An77]OUN33188.1 2,5-diketo-D-gluconic acid reductase [Faecalibacterium sp. An77]
MEYFEIGNGVQMPALGFGTWTLRGEEGRRCIREALEVGYRLLDTARMYENEDVVGQALRDSGLPREEVFLTTKLWEPSNSYQKAKADIDRSLKTLGTDYVDLLLLHEPYPESEEMYRAMEEALRAGKARAIGVSNFNQEEYDRLAERCSIRPAVNQVESHVYYPRLTLQKDLAARGTRMQSWAPFTEGRRDVFHEPVLVEIGAAHGKTAAQTALRYLVQNGIAVIPKSAHRERMEENFSIFDFALTGEEMARIGQLTDGVSLFGWP